MSDAIHLEATALAAETTELRRDFHRHPELAFEETRTAGVVAERLTGLGLDVRTGVGKTGVIAVLDSGTPGRTVLARADMDALPVQEEKDVAYRSQSASKMHACGHDGHTAVLTSVAKLLASGRHVPSGRVVFAFQPAEEIVEGAQAMLDDGALDGLAPDATIGLHFSSMYPAGTVAVRTGPTMAAADRFKLIVRGHGGHAARPHETVDPVAISGQLITGLQTLVSRESDPIDQVVISLTSIHGGSAYNIIPEEVEIKGTLRTFQATTRNRLTDRVVGFSRALVEAQRGRLDSEWTRGSPAVVNDPTMTERLRMVARAVVGDERVVEASPIMGGDDMALWLERAAGCYFFVGARNEQTGAHYPHHHPRFDIDEAAIPLAVELLSKGILDFLRTDSAS